MGNFVIQQMNGKLDKKKKQKKSTKLTIWLNKKWSFQFEFRVVNWDEGKEVIAIQIDSEVISEL